MNFRCAAIVTAKRIFVNKNGRETDRVADNQASGKGCRSPLLHLLPHVQSNPVSPRIWKPAGQSRTIKPSPPKPRPAASAPRNHRRANPPHVAIALVI